LEAKKNGTLNTEISTRGKRFIGKGLEKWIEMINSTHNYKFNGNYPFGFVKNSSLILG
jgi:hypothetical protein